MRVRANGVEIYVVRRGSGPRLLVIHGGPDWDHTYLRAFMGPLEKRAEAVFFDIRGCGRSQRIDDPATLHVSHVVEDVRQLIRYLGPEPCSVLGFSFGGRVGLELIARHPQLVRRFVLASSTAYPTISGVDAVVGEGGMDTRDLAFSRLNADVRRAGARSRARAILAGVRFSNQWLEALRAGYAVSYPERDYSNVLREVDVPVLVLHGENDQQFPVTEARRLAAEVPNARLKVVPEAGHLTHMDAPDEWNSAVEAFLKPVVG